MNTDALTKLHSAQHPILLIVRGLPGSGKSYLASALRELIGHDKTIILDPDTIDRSTRAYIDFSKSLEAEGIDLKFHPWRFSAAKARDAIGAHKVLIWNQPFIDFGGFERTIAAMQTFATEHGTKLPTLVVEVEIHEDTAKARVVTRKEQGGHGPSDEVFDRFVSQYESFSGRGYDTITVHGEDSTDVSTSTILQALTKLI